MNNETAIDTDEKKGGSNYWIIELYRRHKLIFDFVFGLAAVGTVIASIINAIWPWEKIKAAISDVFNSFISTYLGQSVNYFSLVLSLVFLIACVVLFFKYRNAQAQVVRYQANLSKPAGGPLLTRVDGTKFNERWENIKKIKYGHISYTPFLFHDGRDDEPKGFGKEVLNLLLERRVLDFYERDCTWADLVTGLEEGKFDIIATPIFATNERSSRIQFTEPLFFSHVGLYANAHLARAWGKLSLPDVEAKLKNLAKESNKFFAIKGEVSEKYAKKYARFADATYPEGATVGVPRKFIIARALNEIAKDPEHGPYHLMFSEVLQSQLSEGVKTKKVINVLKDREILYPVGFALRRGDYQLKNLLNFRLIQVGASAIRALLQKAIDDDPTLKGCKFDDYFELPKLGESPKT